jgi:glycosyltransferase involved in cell wall biosynthesis
MLDPWFKGRHPIRHLKRWVYWLWGGYPVLRDAHAVFFMSDDERQRAIEAFWLYDCHEFVVRPGTPGIPKAPVEDFAESFFWKHASLRGRRLFTFFAEHDEGEAVRTLARAVALLARRGTWDSQSMRLVIAGQGEQPARDDALKIAADLGIGEGVHWTGALTEREKWGLLAASEAFLRPTAHEICSTRVFDALSAGTPVLVSDGVATWKDIVNDGAGLAGSNTPGGFERMLASWISLPADERAAMRARARRCFEANYTLVGAAHALTSAVYFLIGIHRDSRWDLRPLKPASELA